jgi:hypothetical protein
VPDTVIGTSGALRDDLRGRRHHRRVEFVTDQALELQIKGR